MLLTKRKASKPTKCSQQMSMPTNPSPGRKSHSRRALRDLSLCTEPSLDQLKDSWLSWSSTLEADGHSSCHHDRSWSFLSRRRQTSTARVYTYTTTNWDMSVKCIAVKGNWTRRLGTHSLHNGIISWWQARMRWRTEPSMSEREKTEEKAKWELMHLPQNSRL